MQLLENYSSKLAEYLMHIYHKVRAKLKKSHPVVGPSCVALGHKKSISEFSWRHHKQDLNLLHIIHFCSGQSKEMNVPICLLRRSPAVMKPWLRKVTPETIRVNCKALSGS